MVGFMHLFVKCLKIPRNLTKDSQVRQQISLKNNKLLEKKGRLAELWIFIYPISLRTTSDAIFHSPSWELTILGLVGPWHIPRHQRPPLLFFPTEASLLLLVPLRRTFCGHFPGLVFMNFVGGTLPETKNLKLEAWKTLAFPFGAKGLFSVPFAVSLIRECSFKQLDNWNLHPKKNTRAKRIPNLMNIILFQMGSWFPSRFRESFRPILFYAISFFW